MLFNETLMYNLQYGDHTKTQERVMEAATMAQIPPKLLYNMEMKVGERGSKLSGQCPTHCTGQGMFFFSIIHCTVQGGFHFHVANHKFGLFLSVECE